MKILITGANGFIGRNIKKYLQESYELLTPRSYELDLTNENIVKNYFSLNKIDFIIHCATQGGARGVQDSPDTLENNLKMVDNILKYKNNNVRVILFGSGAMYDKLRNLHKVEEDEIAKFIPNDLYGKSKMLIAQNIKDNPDVLMLNIFACYGEDELPTRFPSYAIDCAINNKSIVINQNCVFDYIYIEDLVKIVKYFIKNKPANNIINLTPTKSVSLLEIAKIVSKGQVDITIKNPEMNFEYTGDNSRLLYEIGDFNFTSIEDGLNKIYGSKRRAYAISG